MYIHKDFCLKAGIPEKALAGVKRFQFCQYLVTLDKLLHLSEPPFSLCKISGVN